MTCKKFQHGLENNIKSNIINAIKTRLCNDLGPFQDEFMRILEPMNPVIIGSFITQCMLGEKWQDGTIKIWISNPTACLERYAEKYGKEREKNDEITNFLTANDCAKDILGRIYYSSVSAFWKRIISCSINDNKIDLILCDRRDGIHAKEFVQEFIHYDVNKNMFNITSSEISIYKMDKVSDKYANLIEQKDFYEQYPKMQRRGFKFYESDLNPDLMTDDEMINYYFRSSDIIKVSCDNDMYKIHMKMNREFIMDNNKIFCMTRTRRYVENPVFTVTELKITKYVDTDNTCTYRHMNMFVCKSKTCAVKLFYPESEHYHCVYITDDENIYDYSKSENGAILILNK